MSAHDVDEYIREPQDKDIHTVEAEMFTLFEEPEEGVVRFHCEGAKWIDSDTWYPLGDCV